MFSYTISESASRFPWLLDMLLKSMVLLALAGIATLACRRASAAVRHLIWTLAVAGVLLLPVLSAILPAWQVASLPDWQPIPARMQTVTNVPARTKINPALPSETTHPSPGTLTAPTSTTGDEAPTMSPSGERVEPPGSPTASPMPSPMRPVLPWYLWTMLAWGIGTALLLGWWGYGYAVTRRLLNGAYPASPSLAALPAAVAGRQKARVLLSDEIAIPMVVGLISPTILLPAQAEGWPEERRHVVLLHERAHIQRRDLPAHFLTQLACACYWMNPLVWVAARRMCAEREIACDDAVLGTNIKAADYAAHLLAVSSALQGRRLAPVVGIAMARSSKLGKRIKGVLDGRRNKRGITRLVGIVIVVSAMMFSIVLAIAQTPEAKVSPLAQRLIDLEAAVGLTPADGAGLTIVLDDRKMISKTSEAQVHDWDLLALVNELWKSGATAIAINDQRIGPATAIMWQGAAIQINGNIVRSPYTVSAIVPATVMQAVEQKWGTLDQLRQVNISVTVTSQEVLHLPGLRELPQLRFVEPISRRSEAPLAVWAGTVPLTGAGVTITLNAINEYTLLQIVNELRAAGAETITINQLRVGPRSAFSGENGKVYMDGVPFTAPVKVFAIGDPEKLYRQIEDYRMHRGGKLLIEQLTKAKEGVLAPVLRGAETYPFLPAVTEKPLDQSLWGDEYTEWFRKATRSGGPIPPGRIERDGKRQRVIIGNRRNSSQGTVTVAPATGKWYEEIGDLFTNDEETTLAYTARNGKSWYMVFAEHEWGPYTDRPCITFNPRFSLDGKRIAYWAYNNGWRISVIDGLPGEQYNWGGYSSFDFLFSADSRRVAYQIPEKGTRRSRYVIDNEVQPAYHRISGLVFSSDGNHYAYIAQNDAEKCTVVCDGKEGQWYDAVGTAVTAPMRGLPVTPDLLFSADGTGLAYAAYDNAQGVVVLNGRELHRYDHPIAELAIAAGGLAVAYRVKQDPGEIIVAGDDIFNVPTGYRLYSLCVSPDGEHVGFVAEHAGKESVYIDGEPGRTYPKIRQLGRSFIFFHANDAFHYFTGEGDMLRASVVVEEHLPRLTPSDTTAPAILPVAGAPYHGLVVSVECEQPNPVLFKVIEKNVGERDVRYIYCGFPQYYYLSLTDARGRPVEKTPETLAVEDKAVYTEVSLNYAVTLKPDEEQVRTYNLRQYFKSIPPGNYTLQVRRNAHGFLGFTPEAGDRGALSLPCRLTIVK